MMASCPFAWTVAAAALASAWVTQVTAHGKLTSPASRNHIDGNAGCSHCLNGGGPCGSSKFLNFKTDPQATWTAGRVVPITILVTAHHMGHYEFRICDQVLDGSISNPDACLNKWVMERASPEEAGFTDCSPGDDRPACVPVDPKHPERWYLPPRSEISGTHTIYFKVPAGLQCQACTLQWHWWSANSCQPAGDYGCFKQILQDNGYWTGGKAAWWTAFGGSCSGPAGPNGHSGCGEQFWNCADIKILPGNGSPSPTQLPTPMPTPVPAPSSSPMPSPVLSPTPSMTCEGCANMFSNPCIWSDGLCNPILREMCISRPGARWCGDSTSTTAASTSVRATTTTIQTMTTTIVAGRFQAVDGGVNRACRGASSEDNSASYYTLQAGVTSLDDCKARCVATVGCNGIEHHATSSRCELWTRSGGIQATRVLNGYTCLSYSAVRGTTTTTTMMVGSFRPVDGGEGRACRGASASDNSASYYDLRGGVATLEDCKSNCVTTDGCTGIEYSLSAQRCEVWTRSIEASRGVSGFSCFSFSSGGCHVRPGDSSGATVEDCKRTCDILEAGVWPCSSDGPRDCSSSIALLAETRRVQLRGRARIHLAAGLGFIQNSTAVTVRSGQNDDESCSL